MYLPIRCNMVPIPATSLYDLDHQQPFQDPSKSQWTHLNLFMPQEARSQAVTGTLTETDLTSSSASDLQEQRRLTEEKVQGISCPFIMLCILTSFSHQIIWAPLDYLCSFPGKDIRGKLISAFNQWLQIPEDKLDVIKRVVGLLHSTSLLYAVPYRFASRIRSLQSQN